MTEVALTGAHGFLGWHTRVALHSKGMGSHALPLGDAFDAATASAVLDASDVLIHIAGVNRGTDDEVRDGNVWFAEQLALALALATNPPRKLVFANSIQAGNTSVYGESKARASDILEATAERLGIEYADRRLPNLYGEHGRPFYNSVVATFCDLLAKGESPVVENDNALTMLHAQDAADMLIETSYSVSEDHVTVGSLARDLAEIATIYRSGDIPDLSSRLGVNLFNTYRSFAFGIAPTHELHRNADARGSFFETTRSLGGQTQSSFSTTTPGVVRGDHYHRRKVERFVVLSGTGTILLRRLFSDRVIELPVSGESPVAVDMPTMWAHRIVNSAPSGDMYTAFWSNELFDPNRPDTYPEEVPIDE